MITWLLFRTFLDVVWRNLITRWAFCFELSQVKQTWTALAVKEQTRYVQHYSFTISIISLLHNENVNLLCLSLVSNVSTVSHLLEWSCIEKLPRSMLSGISNIVFFRLTDCCIVWSPLLWLQTDGMVYDSLKMWQRWGDHQAMIFFQCSVAIYAWKWMMT